MRSKPYIILIILIGWGIFLLLQSYILPPSIFSNLFSWVKRIFLAALFFLISLALGEFILSRFRIFTLTLPERRIFAGGLGLSALSFIIFILGVFRLYYSFTGYIITGILFLLLFPCIKNILTSRYRINFSGYEKIIYLFIGLNILIILLGAFIPPLDYDTLEYHLGVPAQYIKAHRIIYLPYNVYSNFPLHIEMLYLLGLLLYDPILSKLIHLVFFILASMAVLLMGQRLLPRAGHLAALIFINIPIVAITSAKAYNDMGLTLFGLLSIYSLWKWHEEKDKKFLLFASIFTGSAISTKYTGIIFFLLPLAFFIFADCLKDRKGTSYAISNIAIFFIISLLIASPWFIKNLIFTGNPVFPIAYKQFGGKNWGEFEAERFKKHHQVDLRNFKEVYEGPKKILCGQEQDIGITLLLFIPFLFFIKNPPAVAKLLGIYSIFYFLTWTFFTHHMPRFLIPGLAILSILCGFSIQYFCKSKRYISYAMICFLSILFIFNCARLFYQFSVIYPLQFICGKDSTTEYISKVFYLHPAMDFINTYLPEDSKILFIAEARTFYCEKSFLANTPLDKNIIVEIANKSKGPQDILNTLKEMAVTHILYNTTEVRRITQSYQSFNWATPKAQENYIDFMEKCVKIIFSQEGVIVGVVDPASK